MKEANDLLINRRYPRLLVNLEIQGHWWDLEGGRRKLNALLSVVSEGGALLHCADVVPANARVEFSLKLGALRKFDVRGTIKWWRRGGEIRELGVEFEEPVRRIGAYVEKELASGGREQSS